MALRDLVLFAIVFGAIPFVLRRPWIGVMLWVWISLMNPHRLSWGLAYAFPFAQVVATATMVGLLFSREPKQFKGGWPAVILAVFIGWMCVTTFFALAPNEALPMLERVLKIQIFTFIALFVLYNRTHVLTLIWVMVLSIGYYGVKGGAFTLASGGLHRVWGPPESFISDNNALAVAVVMTIPLWAYLFSIYRQRWLRWAIASAGLLSAASALGSQSRGAFLAILAASVFLWLRAGRRFLPAVIFVVVGISLVSFMPDSWTDRMRSINTENQDRDLSSQGRLDAWSMLTNLALDRPIVGGGFEPYAREIWDRYHPQYDRPYSAHSIYFSTLGEHGFVGLALFLSFWAATWLLARRLAIEASTRPQDDWAHSFARLSQASLVGYFVGGAFLDLAYWDGPYYLMVALAVARHAVRADLKAQSSAAASVSPQSSGPPLNSAPGNG